jgi:hypothetical protein
VAGGHYSGAAIGRRHPGRCGSRHRCGILSLRPRLSAAFNTGLLAGISFICYHCAPRPPRGTEKLFADFGEEFTRAYFQRNFAATFPEEEQLAQYRDSQHFLGRSLETIATTRHFSYNSSFILSAKQLRILLDLFQAEHYSMEGVTFRECPFFDQNCCRKMVQVLPNLENLVLAGEQITDAFLKPIVHLGSLRVLDLSGCNRLTDSGLRTIGEGCSNLEALFLPESPAVREKGIVDLISHMREGSILHISGRQNTRAVQEAAERRRVKIYLL